MPDSGPYVHRPTTSRPLVGVLPELLREQRDMHNVFARYAAEARATNKPLVSLRFGPSRSMLLAADPLMADQIMRSGHFENRISFPIIDAIYAQFVGAKVATVNMGGITFVNSEPWRKNRVAALRCLSRTSFVERAERVTLACTDRLIASWRDRGLVGSDADTGVDLAREMSRLAIDVMGHLCWSTNLGAIDGDHDRMFAPVHTMLDAIQKYIYVPLPAAALAVLPTPTLRRLRAAVGQLRASGDSLMKDRFDANANGRGVRGVRLDDSRDDVLSFLLGELVADPTSPTLDELSNVQATLMDLLGAGHDTTANALAFCLGLLSQPMHATWQDRAAEESKEKVATRGGTGAVVAAVYRETLRLYPLGAVFSRVASADTSITLASGDKLAIPAGTEMLVSPYVMGRDPTAWNDPTRFRPERHLAPQDAETGGCPHLTKQRMVAYAPYGGGRRACVGAQFAEVEAHVALRRILSTFRLHRLQGDEEIEADLLFTMRPRRPLVVRLEAR
jgi:cytochrome P450